MSINNEERTSRQRDLVPLERLNGNNGKTVTVVGVGAVGRQAALQLTAMGVPRLQLIDFDTVEVGNLAAQGYLEDDLGRPKVEATAALCRRINTTVGLDIVNGRFRRSMDAGEVVLCCVDSIEARGFIWRAVRDAVHCFVDGRMSAEVVRIVTACDEDGRAHYPATLFTADQAHTGSCTAKSTIYTANLAAGLMIGQVAKWLRRLPVESDLTLNVLSMELSVDIG